MNDSRNTTIRRRAIGLFGVVLLSLSVGYTPTAEGAARQSPEPTIPLRGQIGPEQVDTEKAQLGVEAERIVDALEPLLGDDLGLTWIDNDDAGKALLYVGVKDLGDRRPELARSLASADRDRVQLVDAKYSMLDLKQMQGELIDSLTKADGSFTVGIGKEGTGIAAEPRLDVHADGLSTSGLERLTAERSLPTELVRLSEAGAPHFATNRFAFPPFLAGLYNNIGNSGGCTTAFMMVSQFGYFGSTAGHCAPSGGAHSVRVGNTNNVDVQRQNWLYGANPTHADVAVYSLSVKGWPGYPAIKVSDTFNRVVTGRLNGTAPVGTPQCFVTINLNSAQCDDISNIHVNGIVQGHILLDLSCLGVGVTLGDSGGAVYGLFGSYAAAAGIISGGSSSTTCYSLINYVVIYTGAEVFLGNA